MAVAAASFNTENDSISSTGISLKLRSTPSTSIKAPDLAPNVLIPRIQNSDIFSPGSPLVCIAMIPGTTPANAFERLAPGAFNCLISTLVMAPVKVFFFWIPLAVITTSSILRLSSTIFTFRLFRSLIDNTGISTV